MLDARIDRHVCANWTRQQRRLERRRIAALRLTASWLTAAAWLCCVSLPGAPGSVATASAAGPGEYSAPEWLPLRSPAEVSCVRSNCDGPYHGYWALDLVDPEGQAGDPVYAAGAGQARIVSVSPDGSCGGEGTPANALEVDHGGGVTSRYYHLETFSVDDASWVDRNTQIGVMGSTGYTVPCPAYHLHYEKRVGGLNVDPGPLKACEDGRLLTYPEALGYGSWDAIPALAGNLVSSTGTGCEVTRPTCTDAAATVAQGAAVRVQLSCSGESMTYEVPSSPAHGSLADFDPGSGRVTYTPAAGFSGGDSFTFSASNPGGRADPATVSITVAPAPVAPPPVLVPGPVVVPPPPAPPAPLCFDKRATVVASAGQTVIVGTAGADVIVGGAAAERIDGLGGNDTICAGAGDDVVRGGRGNDRLSGAADDDLLLGGTGNDVVLGGVGDDRTGGGSGWDYVDAGGGNDVLDERALGGRGRDRLRGGSGVDRVRTHDSTADVIDCGADDDVLVKDGRLDLHRDCDRVRHMW